MEMGSILRVRKPTVYRNATLPSGKKLVILCHSLFGLFKVAKLLGYKKTTTSSFLIIYQWKNKFSYRVTPFHHSCQSIGFPWHLLTNPLGASHLLSSVFWNHPQRMTEPCSSHQHRQHHQMFQVGNNSYRSLLQIIISIISNLEKEPRINIIMSLRIIEYKLKISKIMNGYFFSKSLFTS